MTERNYLYVHQYNHYIVYKTTNIINHRFYIGVHAQDIDAYEFDGYFGSGSLIKPLYQNMVNKTSYGKHCSYSTIHTTHTKRNPKL